jgi:hypothetical protein
MAVHLDETMADSMVAYWEYYLAVRLVVQKADSMVAY